MFKSYRYEYSLSPYFEKENKQSRKLIRKKHRHKYKQLLQQL